MVLRLSDCNYNNPQLLRHAGRGLCHTSPSAWRQWQIRPANDMIVNGTEESGPLRSTFINIVASSLVPVSMILLCPLISSGRIPEIKFTDGAAISVDTYNLVSLDCYRLRSQELFRLHSKLAGRCDFVLLYRVEWRHRCFSCDNVPAASRSTSLCDKSWCSSWNK